MRFTLDKCQEPLYLEVSCFTRAKISCIISKGFIPGAIKKMPEHNCTLSQGNLSHVSPWSVPISNNYFFIVPSVQVKSTSDHFHDNRYHLYLASWETKSHVAEEGVSFNHCPHWVIKSQIWLLISQRSSLIKKYLIFSIGSFSFMKPT